MSIIAAGGDTIKTINLYQVREFVSNRYSKQLGRRLRTRKDALRIVRLLKRQGRDVFASPLIVSVPKLAAGVKP